MIKFATASLAALAIISACSQGAPRSAMGLHPVTQFAEVEQRNLVIVTQEPSEHLTKFYFVTKADATRPHDNPEAEALRRADLRDLMNERGYCPKGYDILQRHEWLVSKGLLGSIVDLRYRAQCRDE